MFGWFKTTYESDAWTRRRHEEIEPTATVSENIKKICNGMTKGEVLGYFESNSMAKYPYYVAKKEHRGEEREGRLGLEYYAVIQDHPEIGKLTIELHYGMDLNKDNIHPGFNIYDTEKYFGLVGGCGYVEIKGLDYFTLKGIL